ncbi:MAG: hypothetical protein IJY25_05115 [Bacilli bacterium]|nr:hypothetical protein [Bacilli bacterium]
MKESVGYTVTLNIVIMFIIIVFAFLSAALIYFKSNKIGNVIVNSVEKYEGYNSYAISEIDKNMSSLGYNKGSIENSCARKSQIKDGDVTCNLTTNTFGKGVNGYCIYLCESSSNDKDKGKYYYYRIRTNMMINIPIINDLLNIPIYSNTNRLYDFENNL